MVQRDANRRNLLRVFDRTIVLKHASRWLLR